MAAAARKSAQSETSLPERYESTLPNWVKQDGYVTIPRFGDLVRRLTYGGFLCFGLILEQTVNKRRRKGTPAPEWSGDLSEADLAEWTGLSWQGVHKALKEIEPLIERRKNGRTFQYKPSPEYHQQLKAIPIRDPRKLTPKPKDPKPAPVEAEPIPAALTCPLGHSCPVEEVFEGPEGVLVNIRDTSTGVEVSTAIARPPAGCGHLHSSIGIDSDSGPQPANFTTTDAPPQSPQSSIQEIRDVLSPVLRESVLAKTVDEGLARLVQDALSGTPVAEMVQNVRVVTGQKWLKYGSGLLVNLAREAAEAYRARALKAIEVSMSRPPDSDSRAAEVDRARELLTDPFLDPSERQFIEGTFPELRGWQPSDDQVIEFLAPRIEAARRQAAAKNVPRRAAQEAAAFLDQVRRQYPAAIAE